MECPGNTCYDKAEENCVQCKATRKSVCFYVSMVVYHVRWHRYDMCMIIFMLHYIYVAGTKQICHGKRYYVVGMT